MMSEQEFCSNLQDACSARICNHTELTGIDLSGGVGELRVIEGVECLESQFELFGLGDLRVLQQGNVEIVETRPMEEAPPGIAEHTHNLVAEQRSVEVRVPVARVSVGEDRSTREVRNIDR